MSQLDTEQAAEEEVLKYEERARRETGEKIIYPVGQHEAALTKGIIS